MKQQVLTPAEYFALGYVQRSDFDPSMFNVEPDKPLREPFIDVAYRADERVDYYIDLGVGIVKVGYALSTGGAVPAAKTTLGYVFSLL